MDIKGQHLVVDAYDCCPELLNDTEALKRLMLDALRELNLEVLLAYFHPFSPQGVTGVIAISTSHFTIHTWPEHGYAALDFYTCSLDDGWPALKKLLSQLGTGRFCMYEITRGIQGQFLSNQEQDGVLRDSNQADYGSEWDIKVLREIKNGNHKILYDGSSRHHDIFLAEPKNLQLFMDQELQFSSLDERHYHEALVLPAMEMTKSRERVLILGGGDGLALREVLKYPDVLHVDLVDIDEVVLYLAKNEPAFTALNAGSLKDSRVTIHNMDAKEYISKGNKGYGVIIIDFTDPIDAVSSSLYTMELYQEVGKHLLAKGMIICQANSPKNSPRVFWSIGKTLNAAGFQTKPYFNVVPSFGLWGFHLASREGFKKNIPNIIVPHQAIPSNLETLFKHSVTIKAPKTGLIINSISNLKLHEIYQQEAKML